MPPGRLHHPTTRSHSSLSQELFNSRFLIGLTRDEALDVLGHAARHEWNPSAWVTRQGEPATRFYMLESGRIKLVQLEGGGSNVLVRFSVPGQVFGYDALIKKSTHVGSALAVRSSRTLSWSSDVVWRLMRRYPRLSENVVGNMLVHLIHLQDRCLHLATETVERRLARTLAHLAFTIGRKSGRSILIGDGFSAKDLADLSGTTIFTVSRVLGDWEEHGILEKGRGWVMVNDLDALLQVGTKRNPEPPHAGLTQ